MRSIPPAIRDDATTPGVDRAIAVRAGAQHGLVTTCQLLAAGCTRSSIGRRVAAGRLIAVHRGAYAAGHFPPSLQARAMAALLACGRRAVLSHQTAAALWDFGRWERDRAIDVTAPVKHTRPGIRVHRSRLDECDVTRHHGIPITTAARTLLDARATA